MTASVHLSSVDMQHAEISPNNSEPVLSGERIDGAKKNTCLLMSVLSGYQREGERILWRGGVQTDHVVGYEQLDEELTWFRLLMFER